MDHVTRLSYLNVLMVGPKYEKGYEGK